MCGRLVNRSFRRLVKKESQLTQTRREGRTVPGKLTKQERSGALRCGQFGVRPAFDGADPRVFRVAGRTGFVGGGGVGLCRDGGGARWRCSCRCWGAWPTSRATRRSSSWASWARARYRWRRGHSRRRAAFLVVYVVSSIMLNGVAWCSTMRFSWTRPTDDRYDEVSSQGYAWGYVGSCVPFIPCLRGGVAGPAWASDGAYGHEGRVSDHGGMVGGVQRAAYPRRASDALQGA